MAALAAYRDNGVPVIVVGPVAAQAWAAGFTSIRMLEPWQATNAARCVAPGCAARGLRPEEPLTVTSAQTVDQGDSGRS